MENLCNNALHALITVIFLTNQNKRYAITLINNKWFQNIEKENDEFFILKHVILLKFD